ncbi:hypothetical protein FIV42_16380 [Persicimonas caeni]|uniref:Uncharacterized protein n=1 Tax=Persicimonas caeni TaxID=2292766 RepID=A0A4Y6PVC2_PERCE|nr:hypothetical protein [Persicimonas caeni]QDG52258.1 hypothetical protein FIV42_16380 [Persicimonas caeni]QED33480.1 hypothetical protein FRD00_16375 [Persicimonas caeni]
MSEKTNVRIGKVTTDVRVTDASAMLQPQVLQRIVGAVISELEARERSQKALARERALGDDDQSGWG